MDDLETLNRRARLRELIQTAFDGQLVKLIDHIESRTGKKPNQGELSGLRKDHNPSKSFGDKKARALTEQIGLSRRWFDMPPGTNLERADWEKDAPLLLSANTAQPSSTVDSPARLPVKNERERTIAEIVEILNRMSDKGLAVMLGRADEMARQYPITAQSKAS